MIKILSDLSPSKDSIFVSIVLCNGLVGYNSACTHQHTKEILCVILDLMARLLVIEPDIISMEVGRDIVVFLRILLIKMQEMVTKKVTSTNLEKMSFNSTLER